MTANEIQVGGNHYKKHGESGEQHWDRIWRIYGPEKAYVYFCAVITKYVERYRDKNGIEDLKKAQHYITKLIELETVEQEKKDARTRVSNAGDAHDGGSGDDPTTDIHSWSKGGPAR